MSGPRAQLSECKRCRQIRSARLACGGDRTPGNWSKMARSRVLHLRHGPVGGVKRAYCGSWWRTTDWAIQYPEEVDACVRVRGPAAGAEATTVTGPKAWAGRRITLRVDGPLARALSPNARVHWSAKHVASARLKQAVAVGERLSSLPRLTPVTFGAQRSIFDIAAQFGQDATKLLKANPKLEDAMAIPAGTPVQIFE
mgnify:CR=1 FL=1